MIIMLYLNLCLKVQFADIQKLPVFNQLVTG